MALTPAEIQYGRAAVGAGWIAHERLLALSQASQQAGVGLRAHLLAVGAITVEQDRHLLTLLAPGPPTPDSASWPSQDSGSWPSQASGPQWGATPPPTATGSSGGRARGGSGSTAGGGIDLPGASLPEPGERLGPYTIDRELARGGLGAVFVAHDPGGQAVALKVLLNQAQGKHLKRFEREATVGMRMNHPGICAVLDFGEHEGVAYLTMPFLEGATSITIYAQASQLDQRARAGLMVQVLAALHFAHEAGTIHRDLKPGNVLVTPSGEAKVVDFGLVKDLERSRLTESGQVMGTPHYMAPEQVKGESAKVDRRCDVFALGVILYELIAGRRPFDADTSVGIMNAILTADVPDLSKITDSALAGLGDVIQVAVEKEPERRYPTAEAFRADLQAVLDGGQLSALAQARRRRARRRRLLVAAGVLALLVIASLAGVAAWRRATSGLLSPGAVAERSAGLAKQTERHLRSTRSLSEHPPDLAAWREELSLLERSAEGLAPPSDLALAAERLWFLVGAAALARGDRDAARQALASVPADSSDPAGLHAALAGALAVTATDGGADEPDADAGEPNEAAAAAVEALARAVTAGVRLPELRGWRAQALVRAGLESSAEAEAAELDLVAVGKVRPLSPGERVDLARVHLFSGKPQQAADVLADLPDLPSDVVDGLALARVGLELSQQAPAAALALLASRSEPFRGQLPLRRTLRDTALQVAMPTVRTYERGQRPSEAERDTLLLHLRVARAVLPEEPLPGEVRDPLLTAATTGNGEFAVAVALAEILGDDFDVLRRVALLLSHKSVGESERDRVPQLTEAARRAREHPAAGDLPAEDREGLIMLHLKGLHSAAPAAEFLAESTRALADVVSPLARNEVFELRAQTFIKRDDHASALEALEQALNVDPNDKKLHDYRYQSLRALQRHEEAYAEALAYLRSGLEIGSPNHFAAAVFVWHHGYPLERYEEVRPGIEAILRDVDNLKHPGWWTRAALLQLRTNKVERARHSLAQALRGFGQSDEERLQGLAPEVEAAAALLPSDAAGALQSLTPVVERLERMRKAGLRP